MPESDASIGHAERIERRVLNKKNIYRGSLYFLILTVVGLAVLFFFTNTGQMLGALQHLELRYFSVAVALSVFDMFLGGWRNHIFVRRIKPDVKPKLCFRANLANIFMGAVTPSQTGGGPAQLFILHRGGISLAQGISVSVINFISTLIFLLIGATFALIIVQERFDQVVIRHLIQYVFFIFIGLSVFFIFALWRPDKLAHAIGKIGQRISRVKRSWRVPINRLTYRVFTELQSCHACCSHFLRHDSQVFLFSLALTILLYVNKFTLAYFLMRGLGINANYLTMIAIQALLLFILYFAPSPGASGIAELSIAALMSSLMPRYLLPIFALLQRFFLLYLPAVLGASVVMSELKTQVKEI